MKNLTALILLTALATILIVPLYADDVSISQPLSDQEMASLTAGSCDKAAGIMTGFAFAAGYTFAINPAVSFGFLATAGGIGLGIAILC